VVYLTTLSVAQTLKRRIIERSMKNELERTWKKEVLSLFMVLSRHLCRETEEKQKNLVSIVGLRPEIWIRKLTHMKQDVSITKIFQRQVNRRSVKLFMHMRLKAQEAIEKNSSYRLAASVSLN
jgi:hypothetical protein